MSRRERLPLLSHPTDEPSVFVPENLLTRAAAMKGERRSRIRVCCVLDFDGDLVPVAREKLGSTWTTDAPYRETASQLARNRAAGVLSVEMEAAALMALATARGAEIASLLHVTNALGTGEADFHRGPPDIHERVLACCRDAFAEVLGR